MAKNEFLKYAVNKLSDNKDFISYYFKKYIENFKSSPKEIAKKLKCNMHDYYKVALCKFPKINKDFDSRLGRIADYANVSFADLKQIIIITQVTDK